MHDNLSEQWRAVKENQVSGVEFDISKDQHEEQSLLEEEASRIHLKENSEKINLYLEMEQIANSNPSLYEYFTDIKKSVIRYIASIDKMSLNKIKFSKDNELISDSDRTRRFAHETLITNLNIFSRECAKMGIDNTWRNGIGLDRKEITMWAISVYPLITSEERSQN